MSWHTISLTEADTLTTATDADIIALDNMAMIAVAGDEAESFLQNLLTNDLTTLAPNQARLCGLCNPKGRLLALLIVIKIADRFLLLLPEQIQAAIQQRLTMFILRSKVTIQSVSDTLCGAAVYQPSTKSDALLASAQIITDMPGIDGLKLAIFKQQDAEHMASQSLNIAGHNAWTLLLIEHGLPQVYQASQEAFTPQQVNLELVGGVSFKKGCYPGQEVVARLHYLGKPSRRLAYAAYQGTTLPAINAEVCSNSGEVCAHVVQAAFDQQGKIQLQLSVKLAALAQALFIGDAAVDKLKLYIEESE